MKLKKISEISASLASVSDWSSCQQIGTKWDKSGTFQDQSQICNQNVLKLMLKSPRFIPFGANLTQFGCPIWHHCWRVRESLTILVNFLLHSAIISLAYVKTFSFTVLDLEWNSAILRIKIQQFSGRYKRKRE